ncbi:MAG: type II toxin-antitoxin system VapB family antitoxin [Gaiella sp.]
MDAAIAVEKTSLNIDREKLAEAAQILGTTTIAATVDAALWEVIRQQRKRDLLALIAERGGLGPNDEERRRLRTP